ncbi:MAG: class I SAM-dependent methyltransferase, partial [Pseudomonadota bacterium]
ASFVESVRPTLLFDLGCNTGSYSLLALDSDAGYVVGFDFDQGAISTAFERSSQANADFLPLLLDATNPSPSQGWRQSERGGISERANADALIALALVHHLVIAKNIPMDQAVGWLTDLAPRGVIEFVPKQDPMVQALLRLREDLFIDYSEEAFETSLSQKARIVDSAEVSKTGRRLYTYERG